MQQVIPTHKVICYVDQDGLTTLSCPKCARSKKIDTKDKKFMLRAFKAKCKCGLSFAGQFEFRRHFRKKVRFSGFYKQKKTGKQGYIIIENISLSGVGFSCIMDHGLQRGDELDITFTLDNPRRTKVTLWVDVLHINDRFVGVRRLDIQNMKPELGFYLR